MKKGQKVKLADGRVGNIVSSETEKARVLVVEEIEVDLASVQIEESNGLVDQKGDLVTGWKWD